MERTPKAFGVADFVSRSMFVRVASLVLIGIASVGAAETPPKVLLTIPEAFKVRLSTRQFRQGKVIVASPEYARLTALVPFTEWSGCYGDPQADQDHFHGWRVAVYRALSQQLVAAYATARDGYEANLNECPGNLHCDEKSYMFARFERKHFPWGDAVSFLSQFTQDTAFYVPHNGHLTYEVWGVTRDRRFTVVAHVPVSHPKLAGWIAETPELRDARTLEALKKDKDYKRVERCRPGEFEPSLTAFDRMLDSLVIR